MTISLEAHQLTKERFRRLVENVPDLIGITSSEGVMQYVAPSIENVLGWSPEEVIGQPFYKFAHPDDMPSLNAWWAGALRQSGPAPRIAARVRSKSGEWRIIEIHVSNQVDDPAIGGFVFVSHDITSRRHTEERLQASEARMRSIIETAHEAFITIDDGGTITDWNPEAESTFGWSRQEAIGRSLVDTIIPPSYRQAHREGFEKFLATGEGPVLNKRLELSALHRNGREFPVELTIAPTHTKDRYEFYAFLHDISTRKRHEEEMRRMAEELARSNAELEQFAYIISHDLQEPLRMVANYTQLVAKRYTGRLDSDADEFIGFALEGSKRMKALINDLLAYSRVGTRGKEMRTSDAAAIFRQAVSNLQTSIEEAQAIVSHDDLPTVKADPQQLAQVFQNLIGNAVKFRRESPPRVHVSAVPKGSDWLFSVADNGIGIDLQHKDRIFQIFQRLHTAKEFPGTGVGLAICKKIVERHGGRIWFDSEPGQGSTFYFTLPAQTHDHLEQSAGVQR